MKVGRKEVKDDDDADDDVDERMGQSKQIP